MNVEEAVRSRYSEAAKDKEEALCCPVSYDPRWLKAIPAEVLERDYGCGDPSAYLAAGDTVLDLGSGGGKICFIASQVVGAKGRVIGVDINDEMLALAEKSAPQVAEAVGYGNVEFRRGTIQNLAGVVADGEVNAVVSNCVLNLVATEEKRQLFGEIYRVLEDGGRAIISDIVSDETVPEAMRKDPELWSGCVSGAMRLDHFMRGFLDAGFKDVQLVSLGKEPWRTVDGIDFRSATVVAGKGQTAATSCC